MKTKIIALILALITVLTLVSCDLDKKEKKNGLDLSQYVVIQTDNFVIDAGIYAFFLYDYVGQYSYYLSWYGYDTSLPLTKQTTKCAFDENKTWFEYFDELTRTTVAQVVAFASAAIDAGMSLSKEDLADLDEYIEQSDEDAYKQGVDGIEGLLAKYYCEGITRESFRTCMMIEQLAAMYVEEQLKDIENADYDTETLLNFVNGRKEEFYGVDYLHYTFYAVYEKDATDEEKEIAYAEAKRKAEEFLSANPDLESMKNAIVELENYGSETPKDPEQIIKTYTDTHVLAATIGDRTENDKAFCEWALSPDRQVGDTYIRENVYSDSEKYYTVNCITKPYYIDDHITKNVRHIFFSVDSTLSDEQYEAADRTALGKAETVYNTYKNGEMTSEAFAALAKEHSQDSNASDGGIYENVAIGDMVSEFEDWIYDPARQHGDTEIIKTQYGYHIMFFEGDGLMAWESDALELYKDELYKQMTDALVERYPVTFDAEAIKNIP